VCSSFYSFCVFGECAGSVKAYMDNINTASLVAVHKIVLEYAERIYEYMEKTPRDTKLRIFWLIMVRYEIYFRSLLYIQDGLY
jgi:hypothetical protein